MTAAVALDYFRDFIQGESAIVLDKDKDYLLESRLSPVAKDVGLADLESLAQALRRGVDRELKTRVVEALTTNETYFFRDQHPFETFRKAVIPRFAEARDSSRSLRLWCAAASTGQEPYSLAMVLRETVPDLSRWSVEIVATDINQTVLDKAASGIYRQHEVNRGLPAPLLVKYFTRHGRDWQIKPEIRQMVRFESLNLLNPWPFSAGFDIVFIRNVLIYFDVTTKKAILSRIRRYLSPDGVMFLGGAETTVRLDDAFSPVRDGRTIYYEHKRQGMK